MSNDIAQRANPLRVDEPAPLGMLYDKDERKQIMGKVSSIVIDSLRPNNSWLPPMRAADPKDRWKYYAIRCGVVILLIALMSFFRFSPHNVLR